MKKIQVTKSFLPDRGEYEKYLDRIWENGQLTNQGPLLLELEEKLCQHLGLRGSFHFVTNGTVAIQIAMRALGVTEGEVVTTPFSYVATTSAVLWERCKPVFADIDPDTFCIDPEAVRRAITPKTKAILAVHVFGNPCDVQQLESIAKEFNIKLIYDAAHAFGVTHMGKSLFDYGDISTASFHATKLFHTIEGGGIVAFNDKVSENVELMKRFGHNGDDHYMLGINAKASEFQAAMGLANLKHIDEIISVRRNLSKLYDELLDPAIQKQKVAAETEYNFAYYPILLKSAAEREAVTKALADQNIFPRRYFFPSLNTLPYLEGKQSCPVSEDIAERILSLPLYHDLTEEDVRMIATTINSSLGGL